jgi:hypothetical protein
MFLISPYIPTSLQHCKMADILVRPSMTALLAAGAAHRRQKRSGAPKGQLEKSLACLEWRHAHLRSSEYPMEIAGVELRIRQLMQVMPMKRPRCRPPRLKHGYKLEASFHRIKQHDDTRSQSVIQQIIVVGLNCTGGY